MCRKIKPINLARGPEKPSKDKSTMAKKKKTDDSGKLPLNDPDRRRRGTIKVQGQYVDLGGSAFSSQTIPSRTGPSRLSKDGHVIEFGTDVPRRGVPAPRDPWPRTSDH